MTIYGWDASHYDGTLTVATMAKAKAEGIEFFTHKIGEALNNDDPLDGTCLAAARDAGITILGGYYIPHQHVDVAAEVRRCVQLADRDEPWWRTFPGWFWQADCERWSPTDRPTLTEVEAFCDQLAHATGRMVICYASRGQYDNDLIGLGHPLWNARYGASNPGPFKQLYPGDNSAGWAAYSGQTPVMLQYTSSATIAGRTTCDANAYRGTLAQLTALLTGDAPMTTVLDDPSNASALIWRVAGLVGMTDPIDRHVSGMALEPNMLAQAIRHIADLETQLIAKVDALTVLVQASAADTAAAAQSGAEAGATASADAIAAAVIAQLPTTTLTMADVEQAVRNAFARGLATS